MLICLVEDDLAFSTIVEEIIKGMGHKIISLSNCLSALECSEEPDLYILDVNLPDGSGIDLCSNLRKIKTTPILFLTIMGNENDIISGFSAGADDYITKPFSVAVFRARVSALLQRRAWSNQTGTRLFSGDLTISFYTHKLLRCGEEIKLYPTEWKLLCALIEGNGRLVRRSCLLEGIWDSRKRFINDNTLSVHMSRLRKKLGTYEGHSYIKTEAQFGYRWSVKIIEE